MTGLCDATDPGASVDGTKTSTVGEEVDVGIVNAGLEVVPVGVGTGTFVIGDNGALDVTG